MLPVSLDCLSSPYVLCTQCCQFLWIGCLDKQSRETGNIGYTRHKAKTNKPEKLATLGTQDLRRRQAIQRGCLRLMSCVPSVASFSGLFFFVFFLVYPMLPVSLDCLSSPYVLCTQCCRFHTRHKAKKNNSEKLATLGTQVIR
jgi:ribosomal protein L33